MINNPARMHKMEETKYAQEQSEPRDTYRIAYIIHFFLGACNLLPWNVIITAVDYFTYLYPTKHVEKVFSIAYMSSSILVLALMTSCGDWSRRLSFRKRMNTGLFMFITSLMVAPIIDWKSPSSTTKGGSQQAFIITVASVLICGLADGLVAGTLIGSAGKLPKEYMQAVFAGTASSGVLVCMLRIITKASLPQNSRGLCISTHLYFISSTALLLCCMVCSNLLFMLPVMQKHYKILEDNQHISRPNFRNTARKILWPAVGILSVYIVTLSIFPGFIADDLQSRLLGDWYPILLITTYNISDLVGKSSTALYIPSNVGKATWACTARLLFYPIFTACLHGPKQLRTEFLMVILTFLLGITNGYLTSVLMILAPKLAPAVEAETAAIIMAVFLGIGLAGGSVLGWLWII